MTQLFVHLLSGIKVTRDGEGRMVTSRRQRAVVAALALQPGRSVSVDQLVDAVWGDAPPDGARTTLQTYVSRLRSTLGDDAIAHTAGGYRLADGAESDVEVARRLADRARAALFDAPSEALDAAREAISLWDGPALADLGDELWFAPAVAGLVELHANLVDLAADALVALDRPEEAVEMLEPASRRDPLREPTHVRLVEALCAAGRPAEAVRVAGRYRRQLREETGLDPGVELVLAEQRALEGGGVRPSEPTRRRLDSPIDRRRDVLGRTGRLIGRDEALRDLSSVLAVERLVTVCGPGGVGKTRLVAELVAGIDTGDIVVMVELAPVRGGEVVAAVAAVLGIRGERPHAHGIVERLAEVDGVVVLDNAEHVADEVRDLVRQLLVGCPRVRVLVTSRIRLDLAGEHVVAVSPLTTEGEHAAAVELFAERLAAAGRGAGSDDDKGAMRAICERLDGVPLAIELAAGRAAVLGVRELAERLDVTLDLVASAGEDRHSDLRRVVSWSFDLLDPDSRRLLCALAAFHGEFDLDAAEQIGGAVLGRPVSLLLARLVDASLVALTGVSGRYRLLEMIRQYAASEVEQADAAAARTAHTLWVTRQLVEIAAIVGTDEASMSSRVDGLRTELRAALRAVETPMSAAALLEPMARILLYRPDAELLDGGRTLAVTMLTAGGPEAQAGVVAAAGARFTFLSGDLATTEAMLQRAGASGEGAPGAHPYANHAAGVLALYHGRYDTAATAFRAVVDDPVKPLIDRLDALGGLGLALCYGGQPTAATTVLEEHRAIADTLDSDTHRSFADYMHGEIAASTGAIDRAVEHLDRAAERAWSVGATFIWGLASTVLAALLVRNRPAEQARAHLPIVLDRWRTTGTWPQLWTVLRLTAELFEQQGPPEVALAILVAAEHDAAAPQITGADLQRHAEIRRRLRDKLGEPAVLGITSGAVGLPRTVVLRRALETLADPTVH